MATAPAEAGKLPWFPFYPQDLLADPKVAALSLEEFGAYLKLLAQAWLNGAGPYPQCSLPRDEKFLKSLLAITPRKFQKIWSALMRPGFEIFEVRGEFIVSRRLEKEFKKQGAISEKRRAAARSRWNQEGDPGDGGGDAFASRLHKPGVASQSQKHSNTEERTPQSPLQLLRLEVGEGGEGRGSRPAGRANGSLSPEQPRRFAEFWESYPRKKSKGQAEKAWRKIRPSDELFGEIMAGLEKAKISRDWIRHEGKFIPYPATWLRARGWEDEACEPGLGGGHGEAAVGDPYKAFG